MIRSIIFKISILLGISLFLFTSCDPKMDKATETVNPNWKTEANQAEFLHRAQKKLTDVIVHDIFSPPVASRIYAYSNITAYEILQTEHADYRSLVSDLNHLESLPQPSKDSVYCLPLASVHAFLIVGKALIFSEAKIEAFEDEIFAEFKAIQMPSDVFQRSKRYGKEMAAAILAYADKDNYKQTRTFPKYSITDDPDKWQPTPPDYMDAIEPHWNKIRPFVLDSAEQFTPPPPTPFNMEDKDGLFYKELIEVYEALKSEDEAVKEDRVAIAKFWDCNPYVTSHKGHVMYATKKITPGGHWMGIAQLISRQEKADLMKSSKALTWTAIALADGFISCWDEKYRSKLVRPETVINNYLDEDWQPLLQTPPFPEYTSGHSVISRAAAVALTHVFGDNIPFKDTVEEEYGLPTREFTSFYDASDEAAISRLYGGIHYMPACTNGVAQGEEVGKFIVENLK